MVKNSLIDDKKANRQWNEFMPNTERIAPNLRIEISLLMESLQIKVIRKFSLLKLTEQISKHSMVFALMSEFLRLFM